MSLTPKEKEWNLEIERRKKKIVEEELNLKSNLAHLKRSMIFSEIFRILRLKDYTNYKLKKNTQLGLQQRLRYFLGKKLLEKENPAEKSHSSTKRIEKEQETIHVHIHSQPKISKPCEAELETYRKFLKR